MIEAILSGRLRPGERLPSQREVATRLRLSRSTCVRAYQAVRDAGLLASHPRSGNFVNLDSAAVTTHSGSWMPSAAGPTVPVDLSKAATRAEDDLVDVLRRSVDDIATVVTRDGYDVLGLGELRTAVARRFTRRGLPTSAEQILITAGAQQGIDLVCRLLVRPTDPVVVESPTYAGLIERLRGARAEMTTLDVSDGPWDVDRFSQTLRRTRARLAFVTPDFHNPTGRLMDHRTREAMASTARGEGATVVVDETNVELSLEESPPDLVPFAAYLPDRSSITIGSLSKCLWAGLRVGWIRAHTDTREALANLKVTATLSNAVLEQLAAVRLLDDDWFTPYMHARRRTLRDNRELMHDTAGRLGLVSELPAGGLSCWARLPAGCSSRSIAQRALRLGLVLLPGSRLSPDGVLDSYLRLPFSLPTDELLSACAVLEASWPHIGGQDPARDSFVGLVV